jgi:hypothetical protein
MGLEGIVSKRLSKPYQSGRFGHWLKVKNPDSPAMRRHRTECCRQRRIERVEHRGAPQENRDHGHEHADDRHPESGPRPGFPGEGTVKKPKSVERGRHMLRRIDS